LLKYTVETSFAVKTTRSQKTTAMEYFKRSRVRNGDSRIQVQMRVDGGGDSRQNWMEKTGLWPMLHWDRHG